MPPITFEKLLELNRQKKDLYNQKEELTRFLQAFQRAVRNCDAFKLNRRKAETFADHIFHAKLDPTSREEYTDQEKRRHRFYPQEPKRPLKLVNRDTIENAVSDLEELGDFLGSKVKGEDTNVCDYILRNADYDDAEDIEKGLHIINDTLQLGIPMEQLLAGKEIKATDEEKSARSKRKTELKKQQQRRNEAFEAEVQKVENFHTDRKLVSKAIDDRQRKEDEEEFKRNIEKRDKERKEKERIEQEKRKSAEQKKKEEAERKEAERKDQLKKQEAMREGIEKSVAVYRDPKTPAELKKVQMAMAAAFQAELDRVGPDGNTAIDETRIKENMESYYNSAAFALARDTSSISRTSLDRRLVSSRMETRYFLSSSGGIVPSRIPSANPAIVVIGVRSSWEILAINSLRRFSACSRESAILLNESISAPISSVVSAVCFTRTEKSPLANFREAAAISSRGLAIRLV